LPWEVRAPEPVRAPGVRHVVHDRHEFKVTREQPRGQKALAASLADPDPQLRVTQQLADRVDEFGCGIG